MSKELGWNKMFNLMSAENKTQVTPRIWANKLPFKASMDFQTTTRVKAPNRVGKNRIQNTELPKRLIR
jgi:cytochrome c556